MQKKVKKEKNSGKHNLKNNSNEILNLTWCEHGCMQMFTTGENASGSSRRFTYFITDP